MRKVILSSICLIFILSNNAFAGQVYKGNWSGGGASASFEVITTSPLIVHYCFKIKCDLLKAKGSRKAFKIKFIRAKKKVYAVLKITKKGDVYKGVYQNHTGKYYATFK